MRQESVYWDRFKCGFASLYLNGEPENDFTVACMVMLSQTNPVPDVFRAFGEVALLDIDGLGLA